MIELFTHNNVIFGDNMVVQITQNEHAVFMCELCRKVHEEIDRAEFCEQWCTNERKVNYEITGIWTDM